MSDDLGRESFLNFPQPHVDKIRGNLMDRKYAVLYLGKVTMHVWKVSDLRELAEVATRLADELGMIRVAEVSEADKLRARVAELELAAAQLEHADRRQLDRHFGDVGFTDAPPEPDEIKAISPLRPIPALILGLPIEQQARQAVDATDCGCLRGADGVIRHQEQTCTGWYAHGPDAPGLLP
jgi:hypothetical protein